VVGGGVSMTHSRQQAAGGSGGGRHGCVQCRQVCSGSNAASRMERLSNLPLRLAAVDFGGRDPPFRGRHHRPLWRRDGGDG